MKSNMRVALVACRNVAGFYAGTLRAHPELEVAGVMDCDAGRTARFAACYKLSAYLLLDDALNDPSVSVVVNLTNPRSHFAASCRYLEAGKHVYSEKLREEARVGTINNREPLQLFKYVPIPRAA
jgi:predicted dehydrogenase